MTYQPDMWRDPSLPFPLSFLASLADTSPRQLRVSTTVRASWLTSNLATGGWLQSAGVEQASSQRTERAHPCSPLNHLLNLLSDTSPLITPNDVGGKAIRLFARKKKSSCRRRNNVDKKKFFLKILKTFYEKCWEDCMNSLWVIFLQNTRKAPGIMSQIFLHWVLTPNPLSTSFDLKGSPK